MTKKYTILRTILIISFLIIGGTNSFAESNPIVINAKERVKNSIVLLVESNKAFVKNIKVNIDKDTSIKPLTVNGRVLIPIRFIAENIGANIEWNSENSAVTLTNNSIINFKIGEKIIDINGNKKEIDVAPILYNGRVFLPIRVVSELLNKNILYDRSIIIISEKNEVINPVTEKKIIDEIILWFKPAIINSSKGLQLKFSPSDVILHPSKPLMYITNKSSQTLYCVNYNTKKVLELSFELPPERLTFSENKIYITLLKGEHSPYWWKEKQEGAIAIVNAETFTLKEQFDINIDPWDIEVDKKNHIYVSSGSGQWTFLKSYSGETKNEISSVDIYYQSFIQLHPTLEKVYASHTQGTPKYMSYYKITNGVIDRFKNSKSEYNNNNLFKISPDGLYVFNQAGIIYYSSLNFITTIPYYLDISFDIKNNRFFTSTISDNIRIYKYSDFKYIRTVKAEGYSPFIFYQSGSLVLVSKINSNYYIKSIKI